jgi:single-stranded-DNA-specific exonuclease
MRWTLQSKPEKEQVQKLQNELQVDEIIATLLVQRGITTFDQAKTFFRPTLNDLHNPYLMKDMDKAVSRIEKAIANEENILVFGDYDVDGTTAVSLVSSYLKSYYTNIATYIPDRYDEGYGISYKGIDYDVILDSKGILHFKGETFDTPNKFYNSGLLKFLTGKRGNSGTNQVTQFKVKETGESLREL